MFSKMKYTEAIEKRCEIIERYGDMFGNLKCDQCSYVVRAVEPSLVMENRKKYLKRNSRRFMDFR